MKRRSFKAGEVVELVMPASEAMLHGGIAGQAMRLKVTEHEYQGRVWGRVEWVCRTDDAKVLVSGYSLTECGIRVTDEGYEGQAPSPEDPSPETVRREAIEVTAKLMEIFS